MSVCGTPQHYWSGCREPACRAAHKEYERVRAKRKRQQAGLAFAGIPKADLRTVKHIFGPDTYTLEEIRRFRGLSPSSSRAIHSVVPLAVHRQQGGELQG